MNFRVNALIPGIILLSFLMTSSGQGEDRSPMLKGLASEAGRVLGAASACPNIARPRIAALASKITNVIKSSAGSADEGAAIVALLNDSESEGARSVARAVVCAPH